MINFALTDKALFGSPPVPTQTPRPRFALFPPAPRPRVSCLSVQFPLLAVTGAAPFREMLSRYVYFLKNQEKCLAACSRMHKFALSTRPKRTATAVRASVPWPTVHPFLTERRYEADDNPEYVATSFGFAHFSRSLHRRATRAPLCRPARIHPPQRRNHLPAG